MRAPKKDDKPGKGAPGNGEEAPAEPRGLAGVDVEPLPPATREDLEALRKERDELRDQLLRKRAEFENYRKRVERDRQQFGQEAAAAIFKALVPTLDNLDRALQTRAGEEALRQGVDLIYRELRALLEAQGVVALDPIGQPFDPQSHQALSHEPAPGFAEGTVVEVLRKGFSFKDRLLRPALVTVAKGPSGEDDEGGGEPGAVH